MKPIRLPLSVLLAAGVLPLSASAQVTLNASSLALRSTGSVSGTDWTLNSNGYLGTYIQLASPGSVSFNVQASGTASPRMNLVVGDSKLSFDVQNTSGTYSSTLVLPVGTHFVRLEYANDTPSITNRALTVKNLQVSGAFVLNSSTNTNALNAADTYITHYRKGSTSLSVTGPGGIPLLAGESVSVDLARHAFNFGAAVPGFDNSSVNSYLGNNNTAKQVQYQARLNQNFNSIVPENAGKWAYNEATRDVVTMGAIDQMLNYAQSKNMRARMHNLIWGDNSSNGQQPSWVLNNNAAPNNGLLDKAYLGDNAAKTALREEISERISSYVGNGSSTDRSRKYVEIDVYNESFHTGSGAPSSPTDLRRNYWNVYGAQGIADIYRETAQAIAASGSNAKVFVNEYNVLDDGAYANYYLQNIEAIRNAGLAAGYGDVVGGIGAQYYPSSGTHTAAKAMANFQSLSVQGLPISLTEFGAQSSLSTAQATTVLGEMLRLTFGNANSTGFFMWGFHQESGAGGSTLFAPQAALYTVDTSNFNNWTLTNAGKLWQDQLGIADWDGNPNNGWSTHLSAVVDAVGAINFNGFYGDYNIGGQAGFSNFLHQKGVNAWSLSLAAPQGWSFWNANASGAWSSNGNWTNGVAGGIGQTAHFAQTSASRAVTLNELVTLGQVNFVSDQSYTLHGSGSLTLDGRAGIAALNATAGRHVIDVPVTLADDVRVWVKEPSSTLVLARPLVAPGRTLQKQGAGTLEVHGATLSALQIDAGRVLLSDNAPASFITSLHLGSEASFDIGNGVVVVDYNSADPQAELLQWILTARADGTWTGPGITSRFALEGRQGVALAHVLQLSDPETLVGSPLDTTAYVLRSTLLGDADLDGMVDFDDLLALAQHYEQTNAGWTGGDSNYDGVVNFDDLLSLAQNYGDSRVDVGLASHRFELDWALAQALAPEPALLSALPLATVVLTRRRA